MKGFAFGRLPEATILHAQGLRAAFLECKALGHNWVRDPQDTNGNAETRDEWGRSVLHLKCRRCTGTKQFTLQKDGTRTSRRTYPEGYLRDPGSGHLTAADNTALFLVFIENLRGGKRK